MENINATYWIETAHPIEKAAEALAGEQSSGTFLAIPGETLELKEKHGARIEKIEIKNESNSPSLPGATTPKNISSTVYKQAEIEVSWPIENIGINLPNLMATVAGNLFELNQFSGIRLLDVKIPESYATKYLGPQFGVEGTRKLAQVYERPIIGTIIKPSVGLSPEQTAEQTKILVEAGLDFLKDDELMGDSPHSIFEKRVDAVMMNHSFEHMLQPKEVIAKIDSILKPGGEFMIRIPVRGGGFDRYKEHWLCFDAPRHLFLTTEKGILELIKGTALELVSIRFETPYYYAVGSELIKKGYSFKNMNEAETILTKQE